MDGRLVGVPFGAIEVVSVFGQTCQVEDAEVGRATGPILIIRGWLAKIVEACPHELANHPILVILQEPILFGHIRPPACLHVVAGALTVVISFAVETLHGELVHAS